jgi:hypothetical protein
LDPSLAPTIGCRIIAEFDDDAGAFASAEPEYVPLPKAAGAMPGPAPEAAAAPAFSPPSRAAASAAKKCWLKVLHRFTKHVPEKKNRLRLPDAEPGAGRILVECSLPASRSGAESRTWAGDEVDVADKDYLVLFGRRAVDRRPEDPGSHLRIAESSIPVLWTDIVNIRFEVERVVPRTALG